MLAVSPLRVPEVWPIIESMIDKAYEALDEVTPDVRSWLVEAKGVLWVLAVGGKIEACATSSLIRARRGLACRVVACAGEQGDWDRCIAKIEDYARAEGCYKMLIDGRRGWGRVLADYRPMSVSFEKRL